jgi:thioredoxin reductase (NADPH)
VTTAFPVYLLGHASTPGVPEIREFLSRNGVPHQWIYVERDPLLRFVGAAGEIGEMRFPFVVFGDGSTLEGPERFMRTRFVRAAQGEAQQTVSPEDQQAYRATAVFKHQLASRVGLPTRPQHELYDVVILGAGPAGLTAALYASSEGLRTLAIEAVAAGGQAGTSARIENYPGFPQGISGAELAESTHVQAVRLGAEILIGVELISAGPAEDGTLALELTSGDTVRARTGIAATGVHWRRLEAPGVEELIGAGVHYGSSPSEAPLYRDGDVFVVGGANSAGQAALHLAGFARTVTLVCRADSLDEGMSRYLVERIGADERIDVRTASTVVEARGEHSLERLILADKQGEKVEVRADALFVLIGAQPISAGVEGWLRRDPYGFLMTGPDLFDDGDRGTWWPLERDPYLLEASQPGVFVAGDLRHGSIKRVASAVGDGAMAIALVHEYLSADQRATPKG